MKFKTICQLAVVCLSTTLGVLGQDPTKAAPNQYSAGPENQHVKIVYVHYGPHAKSALHDHPGGVVVNITDGHLRFTDQNGKVTSVDAKRGEARYWGPTKHRVENLADTAYDAVYIVIKCASSGASRAKGQSQPDEAMNAALFFAVSREKQQSGSSPPSPNPGDRVNAKSALAPGSSLSHLSP